MYQERSRLDSIRVAAPPPGTSPLAKGKNSRGVRQNKGAAVKRKSPLVSDLSSLPVVLTIKEVAVIYRISTATIRRGLQKGTFSPQPWGRYPYRWNRDDVALDLRLRRHDFDKRPHGFATTKARPAKATLPSKTSARRASR